MKVLIFPTCIVEKFHPYLIEDTKKILNFFDIETSIPSQSTCCGQIAFNMGDWKNARKLAEKWIEVYFSTYNYDHIIAPSGSCVHMIRENLEKLFQDDSKILDMIKEKKENVYELTEFLWMKLGIREIPAHFPYKVTYHPSCHYLRGLKIRKEPKEFLRKIKGLELIEMEKEELCCGFGGLFSIKMSDLSIAMAQRKADYIEATGADFVTTPDVSCLMNLGGILSRRGSAVKAIHIARIFSSGLGK